MLAQGPVGHRSQVQRPSGPGVQAILAPLLGNSIPGGTPLGVGITHLSGDVLLINPDLDALGIGLINDPRDGSLLQHPALATIATGTTRFVDIAVDDLIAGDVAGIRGNIDHRAVKRDAVGTAAEAECSKLLMRIGIVVASAPARIGVVEPSGSADQTTLSPTGTG